MKKFFGILAIVVLVLIVIVVLIGVRIWNHLDPIVANLIQTKGSEALGTEVLVDEVDLSPFAGKGSLSGLTIRNPEGYQSTNAFELGKIALHIDLGTVRSDPIVIPEIVIEDVTVNFETGIGATSNLSQLLENVSGEAEEEKEAEAQDEEEEEGPGVLIRELKIRGGEIHVMTAEAPGKRVTLLLPDIELKDLGAAEGGVGAEEITRILVGTLIKSTFTAVLSSPDLAIEGAAAIGRIAQDGAKDAAEVLGKTAISVISGAGSTVGEVGKGAGGIAEGVGGLLDGVLGGKGGGEESKDAGEAAPEGE